MLEEINNKGIYNTKLPISKDKLVSFLIEMSDSIANYVDLLDASENVS